MLKTGLGFSSTALAALNGKDVEVIFLPSSVPMNGVRPADADILARGTGLLEQVSPSLVIVNPPTGSSFFSANASSDGQIAWIRLGDPASGAAYFSGTVMEWDGVTEPDHDLAPFWMTELDVAAGEILWVPALVIEVPADV